MRHGPLWVFLGGALLLTGAAPTRAPVLVELFTSEGCSSCPPADRLLAQLDAQVVVLGEHVDYWDHDGWRDQFDSPAFSQRQEAYRRRFSLQAAYAPEMVVDGAVEISGGDGSRALREIAKAADQPKTAIRIRRSGASLEVDVDAAASSAGVFLALAGDSGVSHVSAGENRGRDLYHVAVARSIRKVGSVKRGASFHGTVKLPENAASERVVVFVQEPDQGRVLGAAVLPPD